MKALSVFLTGAFMCAGFFIPTPARADATADLTAFVHKALTLTSPADYAALSKQPELDFVSIGGCHYIAPSATTTPTLECSGLRSGRTPAEIAAWAEAVISPLLHGFAKSTTDATSASDSQIHWQNDVGQTITIYIKGAGNVRTGFTIDSSIPND